VESRDRVLYGAAFIHPAVVDVNETGGSWYFSLSEDVAEEALKKGLEKLAERYKTAREFNPDPVFTIKQPKGDWGYSDFGDLEKAGTVHEIHQGLYIFRDPLSRLIRFLDHEIVSRFAAPFDASEETYPNCMPLSSLGKAEHLSSFPEHLHFLAHLSRNLDVLDGFAETAKSEKGETVLETAELSAVELVHNPSTCYHCYASRQGTTVPGNMAVTAITKCHRFEAANHKDFGRLLEFSMREIIFLGHPDYVRDCREKSIELIKEFAEDWSLFGELVQSNDPFFTNDFSAKAGQQQRMAMKFEYQMAIPRQDKKLSVLSSNLHGGTFGKAFSMRRQGGPLHTGCLAFGIERLALSILAQHGTNPSGWPATLTESFHSWPE